MAALSRANRGVSCAFLFLHKFSRDARKPESGSVKCVASQVAGPYEYTYRRGVDIDSYPIYGELHVYGGGGYVAELRGDRAAIYDKIARLKAGGWIDKYTRAVFLEFAVYNPNVCDASRYSLCRRLCALFKRVRADHYMTN